MQPNLEAFFAKYLNTTLYSDHRSIQMYPLYRSRFPIEIFEGLCRELDRSRKNLGERMTLENEAAVQLYMNAIPETIMSLFCGRLTNMPEHMLRGRIAESGRCDFTITFHGRLTLVFIKLKESVIQNPQIHSDIVAQVMADANGANLFNKNYNFDGIPIRAILTDGIGFEFYLFDFKIWSVLRGVGSPEAGITWQTYPRIALPTSEHSPNYLAQLKVITEVIFDEFIDSYIVGLKAQMDHSLADLSSQSIPNVGGVVHREPTGFWAQPHAQATLAGRLVREAHRM